MRLLMEALKDYKQIMIYTNFTGSIESLILFGKTWLKHEDEKDFIEIKTQLEILDENIKKEKLEHVF